MLSLDENTVMSEHPALHLHSSLTGADRIARAEARLTAAAERLHLDEWLASWGLGLEVLSMRWYLRPLRPQLVALGAECLRRSAEARKMRRLLDEIAEDAREQVHMAPAIAQAELEAVLVRWEP
jgi:hypothetical protein